MQARVLAFQQPRIHPIQLAFLMLLLLAASTLTRADGATLVGKRVYLPVVEDGYQVFSMELIILPGSFPIELEVIAEAYTPEPVDLDSSYFSANTLVIPALDINGISYWAELSPISHSRYRLDAYGKNSALSLFPDIHFDSNDSVFWERFPSDARDIGVGADGSVWVVGTDGRGWKYGVYNINDYGIYDIPGSPVRVDVDAGGTPWIINDFDEIFTLQRGRLQQVPGFAVDIGIGADGSVWVIGTNERGGGYGIYQLTRLGWRRVQGSAVRIDVDPFGVPWVINHDDEIYRLRNHRWERLPGKAKDVGIGADGSVWVIGANERAGGYGVYNWTGFGWTRVNGSARQISVDEFGRPWVVNDDGDVYRGW